MTTPTPAHPLTIHDFSDTKYSVTRVTPFGDAWRVFVSNEPYRTFSFAEQHMAQHGYVLCGWGWAEQDGIRTHYLIIEE